MRTTKILSAVSLLLFLAVSLHAQMQEAPTYLPKFAIKTNLLYWATTTPNLSLEVALAKKVTLDASGNYNPWEFSKDRQIKHWLIQPELRYWLCERFNGSFFGLHGHYADYDVSNLNMFSMGHDRYDGHLYGGGISYGYHWILKHRWSMEATIGAGYARLKYDKYERGKGGKKIGHNNKNYFGPTKIGLSIIYTIK